MHDRVDAILPLRQRGKVERPIPRRSARAPCDIDCEGLQISQAGNPQKEVAEALYTNRPPQDPRSCSD